MRWKRRQKGDAIVEGMISMMLICLVLFGLLQIFYISIADMLSSYSAFKAARAANVGLAEYVVGRVTRTSLAGASGQLVDPPGRYYDSDGNVSYVAQAQNELFPVPIMRGSTTIVPGLLSAYQGGIEWVEYEYWDGKNADASEGVRTTVNSYSSISESESSQVAGNGGFNDYPLNFPMRRAFTSDRSLDMSRSANILNSAAIFMENF